MDADAAAGTTSPPIEARHGRDNLGLGRNGAGADDAEKTSGRRRACNQCKQQKVCVTRLHDDMNGPVTQDLASESDSPSSGVISPLARIRRHSTSAADATDWDLSARSTMGFEGRGNEGAKPPKPPDACSSDNLDARWTWRTRFGSCGSSSRRVAMFPPQHPG